jgi:hypothetical protein
VLIVLIYTYAGKISRFNELPRRVAERRRGGRKRSCLEMLTVLNGKFPSRVWHDEPLRSAATSSSLVIIPYTSLKSDDSMESSVGGARAQIRDAALSALPKMSERARKRSRLII